MSGHGISVQEACDAIWTVQAADAVVPSLQVLHQSLLKDPLDSYDPSEAFLAIQGAALRFHPSQHQQKIEQKKRLQLQQQQQAEPPSEAVTEPSPATTTSKKELKIKKAKEKKKKKKEKKEKSKKKDDTHTSVSTESSDQDKKKKNDNVVINNVVQQQSPSISPPSIEETIEQERYKKFYWSIAEESLWAAAALASVCVGPSWRYQLYQRRLWLSHRGMQSRFTGNAEYYAKDDQSMSTFSSGPGTTIENRDISVGSIRSFSPMTMTSSLPGGGGGGSGNGDTLSPDSLLGGGGGGDHRYPPIPEVLPAAMLRFAASAIDLFPQSLATMTSEQQEHWIIQQKAIAIAQRYLVLALCCESPDSMDNSKNNKNGNNNQEENRPHESRQPAYQDAPRSTEWTIPGAHELVGNMLVFWLRAAGTTVHHSGDEPASFKSSLSIDWWYTLRVARASTDLISTGWRPLPKTDIGSEVVQRLLGIAEKGIALIDGTQSPPEESGTVLATTQQTREERLAAPSSVAEAISALASLSSRGLIPPASQQSTARGVCRLHVISGAIKSSTIKLFLPISSSEGEEARGETEEQIFMNQIESCFADTADFLWILFANQASSANAMATFLEIVHTANVKSPTCALSFLSNGDGNWDPKNKLICMEAGTAVRMMSAAAWGRPPDVVGISHLRNYWGVILDIIRIMASSIHAKVREPLQRPMVDDNDFVVFSRAQLDMLYLALDTVVALGHFIDRELGRGSGEASVLEWEACLSCLEETVAPWMEYPRLDYSKFGSEPASGQSPPEILERAHIEIESLLLRVGALLNKCVRLDSSPFHAIVGYKSQRKLYLFLFEKAIPHMNETEADLLGLAVVCAWSKFGLHLYQYDGWTQTATEIMAMAFTRYDNGSYVHSPRVRLQALKALTYGESRLGGMEDRGVPSALPDGSVASQISFLSFSQEQREAHLELTNNAVLPVLRALLLELDDDEPQKFLRVVPAPRAKTRISGHRPWGLRATSPPPSDNSLLHLEWFAVGLVGKMIRDFGGQRENEGNFVGILRGVAITDRERALNPIDSHSSEPALQNSLHEILRQKGSVRLEAVKELEVCLHLPFGEQPKKHQMAPLVLEAICTVLTSSTESHGDPSYDMVSSHERLVLAIAALVPLARLRLYEGSKLALLSRQEVLRRLPVVLLPLLARNERQSGAPGFPSQIAPFIFVSGYGSQRVSDVSKYASPSKTLVSVEPILVAIVTSLRHAVKTTKPENADMALVLETVTCMCLNTLSSFLLSGWRVSPDVLSEFVSSATADKKDITEQESLVWGKTQAAMVQYLIASCQKSEKDAGGEGERDDRHDHLIKLLDLMLLACDSPKSEVAIGACRALQSTLPSLAKLKLLGGDGNHIVETVFTRIASRLKLEATALDLSSVSDSLALVVHETAALLAVLFEIIHNMAYPLPSEQINLLFDICQRFISKLVKIPPSRCLYVAISCLVATINKLSLRFAETLLTESPDFGSTESDDAASELAAPRAGFMRFLLSELLSQRIEVLQNNQCAGDVETQFLTVEPSNHESLATELDFMERFEVDKSGAFSGSTEAAWLCGECMLLTCRIGSSTSRYRGWVEIVVRCPTSRKRVIVRLLSAFSLTNPEAISMLWSHSDSVKVEPRPTSMEWRLGIDAKPTSALDKAASAMARFDLLMSPAAQDEFDSPADSLSAEVPPQPQAVPRKAGNSNGSPHPSAVPRKVANGSPFGGSPPQSHSKTTQVSESPTHPDGSDSLSINGWLSTVFDGDGDKMQDVKQALRRLNFPDNVIYGHKHGSSSGGIESTSIARTTNRLPVRRLQQGPRLDRAIAVLDRTAPSNTHKMALLYAGPRRIGKGGANDAETMLLEAKNCSPAYHKFSQDLGSMVLTRHLRYFSAGLDVSRYQSDGEFTRVWVGSDTSSLAAALSIVVYHVVNLMPEGLNNRKRHVGNDNILIVFVDKDSPVAVDVDLTDNEQDQSLVSGHFGFVTIYVSVLPQPELLRITVRVRRGMPADLREELLPFAGDDIIPFQDAAIFVRSLAIRADIACRSILDNLAPASNCHERYRILREMSRHIIK